MPTSYKFLWVLLFITLVPLSAMAAQRPNIIVMVADDLGWNELLGICLKND